MSKSQQDIEKALRALLDGLRNAHLAIAQTHGSSAIAYANEADEAARRLQALVHGKPELLVIAAQLAIDVLSGGVTALKTLLHEVESKRAGAEEITAFLLRPLPPTSTLDRLPDEN